MWFPCHAENAEMDDFLHPAKTTGDASPQDQLEMDGFGRPLLDRDKFDCPLCRSTEYLGVQAPFQCAGCTVTFTDPCRFKRLVSRTKDRRGMPQDKITRGPDDRPMPYYFGSLPGKKKPVGGWSKREVD